MVKSGPKAFEENPGLKSGEEVECRPHLAGESRVSRAAQRYPIVYVPGYGAPPFHSRFFRGRLEMEGFDVYQARLPGLQTGDVAKSAAILAREIQKALELFDADRVNIVAHSLGGIISRYYLQKLGGWRFVHRAVYLGTPHKGVYLGLLGLFTKAARQILPRSKLIEELNSDPSRCREIKCLSIISNFDEVVIPKHSAVLECGYNKKVNWPLGHWGLVFSNKALGWIVDFFDGIFDIREGFARVGGERDPDGGLCGGSLP